MVNSRLKLAMRRSLLAAAAVRSIRLEIAVRNKKAVFEAVPGDLKCRRSIQRCGYDAFKRDAAKRFSLR